MILEVTKLGRLEHARVDLSDRLIIFTGENNTGKTYLSYLIYGLGSGTLSQKLIPLSALTNMTDNFVEKKIFNFNAITFYREHGNELYMRFSEALLKYLPELLVINPEKTSKTSIKLSWEAEADVEKYFKSFADAPHPILVFLKAELTKSKELNSGLYQYTLKTSTDSDKYKEVNFSDFMMRDIINEFIPLSVGSFIPAERIGISIFGKEIFSNRYELTNQMRKLNDSDLRSFLNRYTNLYPKVIEDALTELRSLKFTTSYFSSDEPFKKLADELEEKVLGGKLEFNENEDIFLKINDEKLGIQSTGSTIKSLSSLIFILRHSNLDGKTIIIDEPEANLHPDNQRILARILAKLVNLGVRVIISTHSDYILREFNNLIMLSANTPAVDTLKSKYGYDTSEILDSKIVGAYLFKKNKDNSNSIAEEILIGEDGIQVETINAVINHQNAVSHDIYFSLQEEKDSSI